MDALRFLADHGLSVNRVSQKNDRFHLFLWVADLAIRTASWSQPSIFEK
jgi:hypothetical protein